MDADGRRERADHGSIRIDLSEINQSYPVCVIAGDALGDFESESRLADPPDGRQGDQAAFCHQRLDLGHLTFAANECRELRRKHFVLRSGVVLVAGPRPGLGHPRRDLGT